MPLSLCEVCRLKTEAALAFIIVFAVRNSKDFGNFTVRHGWQEAVNRDLSNLSFTPVKYSKFVILF